MINFEIMCWRCRQTFVFNKTKRTLKKVKTHLSVKPNTVFKCCFNQSKSRQARERCANSSIASSRAGRRDSIADSSSESSSSSSLDSLLLDEEELEKSELLDSSSPLASLLRLRSSNFCIFAAFLASRSARFEDLVCKAWK